MHRSSLVRLGFTIMIAMVVLFGTNGAWRVQADVFAQPTCDQTNWPTSRLTLGATAGVSRPDVLVIAPHGTYDSNTKELATAVAGQVGSSVVWATDTRPSLARRINVNRPTELRWGMEVGTLTALHAFRAFSDCVDLFPHRLSLELHGDRRDGDAEMATVGLSPAQADRVKLAWARHFDQPLVIDAAGDDLVMSAGANKRAGLLSRCAAVCLHLELPADQRADDRLADVASRLSAFLDEVSLLDLGIASD